jgi:1,4-dihydroxy-2-naphthoate octaprenyltransferase
LLVIFYIFFVFCLVFFFLYTNNLEGGAPGPAARRSLAVRAPRRVYRGLIVALTASEPAAILLALAVGAVPLWYPLFLLPVLWLRVRQARTGLWQDNPLGARKLGVKAHRLGVVVVLAATLLAIR